MKRILSVALLVSVGIIGASLATLVTTSHDAHAANASNFKPGRIIDDSVFYNKSSMNASQIQAFLNAKNPNCDTNGSQPASDWGRPDITRAQFAQLQGWHGPPYTCMKDYKQNTPQMEAASGLCGSLPARTNRTAAQIIDDVAKACNINPQVLLVLLQKEQSLVTDTWPLQIQYRTATGFACPDTAPCDPKYNGFFYQVYHAARQFNVYRAFPSNYNYMAGRTNRIYWHPDLTRCGSSQVYIENQATAALYIYTPYRPNQAAMSNLYGLGNSCSSYGNRNFWRLFTDWFGSTTQSPISFSGLSFEEQPHSGKNTTVTFSIKNNSKFSTDIGRLKVEARGPNNEQVDFPSISNIVIGPKQTFTYRQSKNIEQEGQFRFFVTRNYNNTWMNPVFGDFGSSLSTEVSVYMTKEPVVSTPLSISTESVHKDQPVTMTFSIKNTSTAHPVTIGNMKVEGRHSDGTQYDFPTQRDVVIQPGETFTYNETRSLPKTGAYTFKILNFREAYRWSADYPASENATIKRSLSTTVKQSVTVTQSLQLSATSTRIGDPLTATFTMRNFSDTPIYVGRMKVEGRHSDGTQYDFGSTDSLTLQPGQTYVYEKTRSLPKAGNYSVHLVNFREKEKWSTAFPVNESSSIVREQSVSVKEAVTITENLSLSKSAVHADESIAATFKIKNHSSHPVTIGNMKVEGRHSDGTQYDFPTQRDVVIQPGETFTYNETRSLPKTGAYTFKILNFREAYRWSADYPASENATIKRSLSTTVKQSVTVITGLNLSKTVAQQNETITATFTIKNFSTKPINIGRMKVEAKVGTVQYDFPSTPDNLILQPGGVYTYNMARKLPQKGVYHLRLLNHRNSVGWSTEYPLSESTTIPRTATITVQ